MARFVCLGETPVPDLFLGEDRSVWAGRGTQETRLSSTGMAPSWSGSVRGKPGSEGGCGVWVVRTEG